MFKEIALLFGLALFFIFMIWLTISSVTFKFRHPWVTETEQLIYIKKVLFFEEVSYSEMRPRE